MFCTTNQRIVQQNQHRYRQGTDSQGPGKGELVVEEYNIIGSTGWVEQFHDELSGKAVAYINADKAACGPNFGAAASSSLKQPVLETTKAVLYPGSDHLAFYLHVGIPSAGLGMGGFTPYHTAYYNLAWYERFADPDSSLAPQ